MVKPDKWCIKSEVHNINLVLLSKFGSSIFLLFNTRFIPTLYTLGLLNIGVPVSGVEGKARQLLQAQNVACWLHR